MSVIHLNHFCKQNTHQQKQKTAVTIYIRHIFMYLLLVLWGAIAQANNTLIQAVYQDDIHQANAILTSPDSIVYIDKKDTIHGYTPLLWASYNDNTNMVRLLLNAKADANIKGDDGNTPLMWAIKHNNVDMVDDLMAARANIHTQHDKGMTPLLFAVQQNHVEIVKILISAGADTTVRDVRGNGLMDWAVHYKNEDLIKILATRADMNDWDAQGRTPLIRAVQQNNMHMIRQVLDAGANVNTKGKDGNTPLIWAIYKNRFAIVKYLVSVGADVNLANDKGRPPLLWAMQGNNAQIINLIAYSGANVDVVDKNGNTPLEWAINDKNLTVVKILVVAGADLNRKNTYGIAPLVATINHKQASIAKILIAGKADVNVAYKGKPAIYWAIDANDAKMVRMLLYAGAKVDYVSENGIPLLMMAVQQNNLNIVNSLLTAGVDIDAQNKHGVNAMTLAIRQNLTDIIQTLKTAGASSSSTVNRMHTIKGAFLYRNRNYGLAPENLIRLFKRADDITLMHELIHMYFYQYEMWAKKSDFHKQQMQQVFAFVGNTTGYLSANEHEILVEATLKWLANDNPMGLSLMQTYRHNSLENSSLPEGVIVKVTPQIVSVLKNMFATYIAHGHSAVQADVKRSLHPFTQGAVRESNTKLLMAFLQTQSPYLGTTVQDMWHTINLRIVKQQKFTEKLPLTPQETEAIRKNKTGG